MTAVDAGEQGDHSLRNENAARHSFDSLSDGEINRILDPREQKVLRLKWGLEDGREYNNREIGLELRLGDERVRQIHKLAVQKLLEKVATGRSAGDG